MELLLLIVVVILMVALLILGFLTTEMLSEAGLVGLGANGVVGVVLLFLTDTGKVALYLRVSSDEQRERESIKTQREFFEQYCELYGLEVTETYADDGVSGTAPLHERPEGRRLLEDARAKRFETLLVYRLDRLGRSLLVIVDAHDRLQATGASLSSATEPIDTSNPSGRLIFQMLD